MKNILIAFSFMIFLFSSLGLMGQTVYSEPEFPTADQFVTVFFNSTDTPLENYNGDVYTHTGITINGSQWQHVIGSWGNNSEQPKLTKISSNLYKLEMDPSIRDYYGASASENISELCMVFRSEDAGTQSSDLFLPVFDNELSIFIESPQSDNLVVLDGDEIGVSAVSPLADSIYLYLNDVEIKAVADIYLTDTIIAENPTTYEAYQWVKIKAVNETAMVVDSFSFVVIPTPPVAELPAGMKDGINYLSSTSVILSLYVPGKEFVFVIGEFNNWELSEESYMNRTPDGNRFWLQIDNLVPGQEYAYQYYVDGSVTISDPYAELVLDPAPGDARQLGDPHRSRLEVRSFAALDKEVEDREAHAGPEAVEAGPFGEAIAVRDPGRWVSVAGVGPRNATLEPTVSLPPSEPGAIHRLERKSGEGLVPPGSPLGCTLRAAPPSQSGLTPELEFRETGHTSA